MFKYIPTGSKRQAKDVEFREADLSAELTEYAPVAGLGLKRQTALGYLAIFHPLSHSGQQLITYLYVYLYSLLVHEHYGNNSVPPGCTLSPTVDLHVLFVLLLVVVVDFLGRFCNDVILDHGYGL